jgi:4-diphosphocytidyl-2-C-methyl-D-erythritol kinase
MGGGSADAAAVLLGLNRLWGVGASPNGLQSVALMVGADVPFMLAGGLARVGGIGDAITPLRPLHRATLVVVQPCLPLSTREVFAAYDARSGVRHPDTARAEAALLARDYASLSATAGNVLAQASERARPQIAEAVAALQATGAHFATMTGSGSAVFGAFTDENAAQTAYRTLKKRWRRCWLTETAEEGITITEE